MVPTLDGTGGESARTAEEASARSRARPLCGIDCSPEPGGVAAAGMGQPHRLTEHPYVPRVGGGGQGFRRGGTVPWSTLIEGLSPAEQKEVARRCAERTYRRGQVIFSVGDSPDALYLLRKGWVKLRLLSQEGQESIVQMFRPGDVFGEILLAVSERAFEAVALDEVRVALLSRSQLLGLLQSVPLFGMNFIRFLSARLAEVQRDLAAFGHAAASRRLARTLLRLAEQEGEETPGRGVRLPRPVTHETLANLIGTSRETVSAQMRRFAQAGLLTYSGRNLVLRAERLRALLDSLSRPRQSRRPPGRRPGSRPL